MKCPYCGREVVYSDRFCKCGKELDMLVCPNCGTPNISIAAFCGNCGCSLYDAEPYIPPEEPEEPEEAAGQEPEEAAAQEPEESAAQEPEEAAVQEPEEAAAQEPEEAAVQEPEEAAGQEPEEAIKQESSAYTEPEETPEPAPTKEPVSEPESEPATKPDQMDDSYMESEAQFEENIVEDTEIEQELAKDFENEPETESGESFGSVQDESLDEDYVPEEDYAQEEGFAAEQESEEGARPDQSGGKKRRRGGLIALIIVIIIVVVIAIILAVLFTHRNREESNPVENTENLTDSETVEEEEIEKEEEEEDIPATVSDVSFHRQTTSDNKQEYAVVTATDDDGNAVWEYTTPKYDVTDLDRVSKIGMHGNSYFLVQDGAVVSLDKATGDVLWENGEYGGTPVDHSWDYAADGLYLCGYEGPAIFAVSYDGETLGKIDAFDDLTEVTDTNLYPYKVYVSGTEATVLLGPENVLKDGDKAISEEEATSYTVDLETWEYQLLNSGETKKDDSGTSSNGGDSSGSNGGSSGSSGGSSGSSGGSSGNNGGSSGSNGGSSGSNGGSSGGSGSGGDNGGSSGGSGSGGDNGGSSGGSGSGGGSGSDGGNGGTSQAKFSMSDVKDVTASSYLYEENVHISHDPKYLVDGTLKNCWCESASGDGAGQWAKVTFNGTYSISGMNINAGYQKSESLYYENNRPKEITITFSDGSSFNTTLQDVNKQQTVSFSKAVNTSSVTITIRSVYKGSKYEDTCISEVAFY